jgi:hypothetical protein
VTAIYSFPIILVLSLVGCFAGTFMTDPDDDEVLMDFYVRVRPWGFWKPIHEKVILKHPGLRPNRDFKRDMLNILVGIVWQTSLVTTGILLVLESWTGLSISIAVVLVTTVFLKFNWYDRMEDWPDEASRQSAESAMAAGSADR